MKVTSYRDPFLLAIDIAQDRPKALLLWEMEKEKKEIGQLAYALRMFKREMVVNEIQELIELGLVSRKVHRNKRPMLIEFALTNRGAQYLKCLRKMIGVGIDIMLDFKMNEYLVKEGYAEKVEEEDVTENAEMEQMEVKKDVNIHGPQTQPYSMVDDNENEIDEDSILSDVEDDEAFKLNESDM